jgi:ABC-type bacteriocin/lantibiotic exporter with double-glycine peptidase domain
MAYLQQAHGQPRCGKKNKIGRWVVVDGLDDAGRVMIRDPWQATRYKMDLPEFQNTWTGYSVWGNKYEAINFKLYD